MPAWLRRTFVLIVAVAVLALIVIAFIPDPVPVDLAEVARGPMQVTVDEDGRTRIKERYVVSAPLAGRLRRVDLEPGDAVENERTILAVIEPTDPSLLDARARAESEARVRAAEAGVQRAGAEIERTRSVLDFAEEELARLRIAFDRGAANEHEIQEKEYLDRFARGAFRSASFAQDIARFELEQAQSALLVTTASGTSDDGQFMIRAPIDGRVLRVFQESMSVVTPGTALLELGDPADLEVVIDVLSADAVRIEPGDTVVIEHWGGEMPLEARVRTVEPSAFTKVSALGVEEQRVNVIGDFVTPFAERRTLADGYRVEARIVTWSADDIVQLPASAAFRSGEGWSVFVVADGRAARRPVEIGRRNGLVAEIRGGVEPGDTVIVHPSDAVADGVRVARR